jgi:hypothetical protein
MPTERKATWWDWLRWLGALAAVALGAVLVVGSHYDSGLRVCEFKANAPSQEVCKPYPVEGVIPLFILALALMWRDLSEFSIYGLGRVVRKIDDNQQRLQEGQAALQGQLSVIQFQTLNNNFYFGELMEEAERLRSREPNLVSQAEATSTAWSDLQQAWAKLEPWSRLAIRVRDPYFREFLRATSFDTAELNEKLTADDRELLAAAEIGPDTDIGKLEAWASTAHRRLELARKAIRMGSSLPEPQLEQALAVVHGLLHDLREEGLSHDS